MDLEEIGITTKNWVDQAQDRDYWRTLVNAEFNLRVPLAMELVVRYFLMENMVKCIQVFIIALQDILVNFYYCFFIDFL